jgi:hypothetical protein
MQAMHAGEMGNRTALKDKKKKKRHPRFRYGLKQQQETTPSLPLRAPTTTTTTTRSNNNDNNTKEAAPNGKPVPSHFVIGYLVIHWSLGIRHWSFRAASACFRKRQRRGSMAPFAPSPLSNNAFAA